MKILSISELSATYAAMTPGDWRAIVGSYKKSQGHILTASNVDEDWANKATVISHLFSKNSNADFEGIAECKNAIPLLLEAASALMEWVDSPNSDMASHDNLVKIARRFRP